MISIQQQIHQNKWLLLSLVLTLGLAVSISKQDPLPTDLTFIDRDAVTKPRQDLLVNLVPLRNDVRQIVSETAADSMSVYIEYLPTGASLSVNNDLRIFPASLSKLPLALAVMKKVEDGKWKMSNELVLLQQDRDPSWGELHKKVIGSTFTIEELLKELLIQSDNTAYNILYRNMAGDELENMISELGMEGLFDKEGKITAKDYARILRSLYISTYLEPKNSEQVLAWMTETPYKEYLQSGLPDSIHFSHNIGENRNKDTEVISDAGIVYLENRPYMIAVMIDLKSAKTLSRSQALAAMSLISQRAYTFFSTANKK